MFGYIVINQSEMKFKEYDVIDPIIADCVRA